VCVENKDEEFKEMPTQERSQELHALLSHGHLTGPKHSLVHQAETAGKHK